MCDIKESELEELVTKAEFMIQQLQKSNDFCEKLTKRVTNGDFDGTQNGMSLLEVKFHLMAMYNARLSMYMSMRARGDSVANHQLLNELAIICWISDKLRNIQKQCQYSIDKLLDHAKTINLKQKQNQALTQTQTQYQRQTTDNLTHKPDLSQLRPPTMNGSSNNSIQLNLPLTSEMNKSSNRDRDGVYRPPKINPVLMDNPDNNRLLSKQESRQLDTMKRRMKKSDYYQAMRDEYTTLPQEQHFHMQSKTKKVDAQIDEYEENTFKRTPQSRVKLMTVQTFVCFLVFCFFVVVVGYCHPCSLSLHEGK